MVVSKLAGQPSSFTIPLNIPRGGVVRETESEGQRREKEGREDAIIKEELANGSGRLARIMKMEESSKVRMMRLM